MEKALADFAIHWGSVGPFHDLSKVLRSGDGESTESYGENWVASANRQPTPRSVIDRESGPIYETVRENEVLARLGQLHARWDRLLFDVERRLDDLATQHERYMRTVDDLILRQATYCLNFKYVNQKFNALSERKAALAEKLAVLEEIHNHYAQYKCFVRRLDQIENNEFIPRDTKNGVLESATNEESGVPMGNHNNSDNDEKLLVRTLEYVNQIATKLNAMLPAIDASIDFFSIHTDYFHAETTRYQYEALRTSIFGIIKMIFKELYNFANESCKGLSHFDVAEHYNRYRRIGQSVRVLSRYYTMQVTELSTSEFLQLQMYYITSRIKILNPLMMKKMESFQDFEAITSFFLLICNLEILTFKETFVSDATHESLGTMVENVVFYFTEACKQQVARLETSTQMRAAMANLKQNLMEPIAASNNDGVLRPLMLKAQQTYQTIELLLIKNIQRDVAEHVRGHDKQRYLDAFCSNEEMEPNWDHELLLNLRDSEMRGMSLYSPVCFAIGILMGNMDYLGEQNINGVITSVLNATKAEIIDLQYAFHKKMPLEPNLTKINEDLFLMRHVQHLLERLSKFKELEAYRTLDKLYATSEQQLCSALSIVLLADLRDFTSKQASHDNEVYHERLTAARNTLSTKLPLVKNYLAHQLLEHRYSHTYELLLDSLGEASGEYAKKFGLEQPDIVHDSSNGDHMPPPSIRLQL
ncbi:DNA repair protein, putative [Babesia ovis]|uniref:DNA repair protein, putative n=1 Tax=Babesia ovis TaxID=5869 RepID=A0A9W5WUJ8_BABOV|nr:DNA repair protein, putative [Babesia ovis]